MHPESELPEGIEVPVLGAVYSREQTVFSLWSPDHRDVRLRLDGKLHPLQRVADFGGYEDVYQVVVPGDLRGKPYHFLVNWKPVRDPYGKMNVPGTEDHVVLDPARSRLPEGWAPRPALERRIDSVIYELHVRDFTICENSGVSPELRGTFLGLVEPGTAYLGRATCLDHLVELGVTHVQLMPVNDYYVGPTLSDEAGYNWGYNPRSYNCPTPRYSRTPFDYEARAGEFKRMVDGFHRAGIRVVLDVVYNHTFHHGMFRPISERYYTEQDLSGCGNSLDTNVPMVSRMVRDSLEYWVDEYGVDGFRFDLMGIFDYEVVGEWARHLHSRFPERGLLLYGEPWNGYSWDPREPHRVRLGTIGRLHAEHVGAFNPKYRDAIRGRGDDGGMEPGDGFLFHPRADTQRIQAGSRGGIRYDPRDPETPIDTWDPMFAIHPEQCIQYVSAHDNLTLRDKILAWAGLLGLDPEHPGLRRLQKYAGGLILTSQGIPFLHAGIEMMRDKGGERNSYNAPDSVNAIDWAWKRENADIFEYYQDVLTVRRAHPAFRLDTWQEVEERMRSSRPAPGVVVHHIDAAGLGDPWGELLLVFNSGEDYTCPLPKGDRPWKVALEASNPLRGNGRVVRREVLAEGSAVTLLYRD